MANGTRSRARKRSKRKVKFFYLDGNLHQLLHVIRPSDLCVAWSYPERKRKGYVWSDVQKRMTNAYTISETAKLLNRAPIAIRKYLENGDIDYPQRRHKMDENYKPTVYMFSEDDVLKIHDYLLTVHWGRPRHDGLVRPKPMPTRAELKALMRHDTVMYVKSSDDEYVPLWKEPDW